MSEKTKGESEYAKKCRRGDRMYGPCRVGPYDESLRREIEDVKYWVGRLRAQLGRDGANEAITLDMIRAAKEAAKLRAA